MTLNPDRKQLIIDALRSGPKTGDELAEAAGLTGNLSLFHDCMRDLAHADMIQRNGWYGPSALWVRKDA